MVLRIISKSLYNSIIIFITMNSGLLLMLSIIGLLALYWVLFGQWKYNNMMREADGSNLDPSLSEDNKITSEAREKDDTDKSK